MESSRLKFSFIGDVKPTAPQILDIVTEIKSVSIKNIHLTPNYAIVVLNEPINISTYATTVNQTKLALKNLKFQDKTNQNERTVIVSGVSEFISCYTDRQLIDDIHSRNNYLVDQLFIIKRKNYRAGQDIALKIIMKTNSDADAILANGININRLKLSKNNVKLEDPLDIIQCFKCLQYEHEAKNCKETQAFCSKCAGKHSFKQCNSNFIKCKLCENDHIAISWKCPIRKKYIQKLLQAKRDERETLTQSSSNTNAPTNSATSKSSPPKPSTTSYSMNSIPPSAFPPLPQRTPLLPTPSINNNLPQALPTQQLPIPSNSQVPPLKTNPIPKVNSIPINQQKSNITTAKTTTPNININNNLLLPHAWEVQLSAITSFAHMVANGDPVIFLHEMNGFMEQHGIPKLTIPQQSLTQTNNTNATPQTPETNTNANTTTPTPTNMKQQSTNTITKTYANTCTSPTRPIEAVIDLLPPLSPIQLTQLSQNPTPQPSAESNVDLRLSPVSTNVSITSNSGVSVEGETEEEEEEVTEEEIDEEEEEEVEDETASESEADQESEINVTPNSNNVNSIPNQHTSNPTRSSSSPDIFSSFIAENRPPPNCSPPSNNNKQRSPYPLRKAATNVTNKP